MDGKIPVDIEKTAAWITAHRLDLRKEAGIQICQMIAEALRDERSRRDAELSRLRAVLGECEDYFANRADADCDQDGFIPNEEMVLLSAVRGALNESREGE